MPDSGLRALWRNEDDTMPALVGNHARITGEKDEPENPEDCGRHRFCACSFVMIGWLAERRLSSNLRHGEISRTDNQGSGQWQSAIEHISTKKIFVPVKM
jgi:hypothetical protein